MKGTKKTIFAAVALILVCAAALTLWLVFRDKPVEGAKAITVTVVADGATLKTLEFRTDAEYLREALDEQKLIAGSESAYGFFITEAAGRKADETKQEWWKLSKDGEMLNTGVSDTPVYDADRFELTLIVGWD